MALKTPIINIMTKAAYEAGRNLIKDFREVENLQVSKKGVGDFVTSADLKSEEKLSEIESTVKEVVLSIPKLATQAARKHRIPVTLFHKLIEIESGF